MTATIAIQDVLIPQREIDRDLAACVAVGIKPVRFGLIPFSDEITCDDPADLQRPAIPFGSVKLIRLWQQDKTPKNWHVFYSDRNFDQCFWLGRIKDRALNAKACVVVLGEAKYHKWSSATFIKPTNDLKAFAGMLLEAGETISERLAQATQDSSLTDDQLILVAPAQEIDCEFRCYMHKSRMMAASRYRTGLRADHRIATPEETYVLEGFVARLAESYMPAPFYAVDIAFLPDGLMRVVEYNCINCSGRYESDRGKLFKAMLGP